MKLIRALLFFTYWFFSASPSYADIRVGTVLFYPPFVMSQSTGFDIEFIQQICQNLQQRCSLITMDFNQLYKALSAGEIDIAIGGITIASASSDSYIYSLPYLLSKGVFLVSKNSNVQNVLDLKGTKIGILKGLQDGGVFYSFLNDNFIDQFQIIQYNNIGDIITSLSKGDIAASFMHESTALYWQLNGSGQFKLVGKPMIVGNGIGIMSTPDELPLMQKINQQIQKIEKEPVYLDLYNTYFANEL